MCNCKTEEKSEGNVWVKRIGLIILILGLFPEIYHMYPEETFLVVKWVVIFAGVTYGISLLKGFVFSFFK